MKYNLFIGRWCPFHNGHKAIIDSFVKNGLPVCIAIRDTDERYPVDVRVEMIRAVYQDTEMVKIIVIPDIRQVCVGRDVGYSLVEVPEEIKNISATKIRAGLSNELPKEVQKVIVEWEQSEDCEVFKEIL